MAEQAPPVGAVSELTLAALRSEIDAVDDAVLALIGKRQALARKINTLKGPTSEGLKLRPDREAHVIRRLLDGAGSADRRLVLALWRELLSAGLAVQAEVSVAVWSSRAGALDQARLRFGVSAAYRTAASWREALDLADGGSVIAVLDLAPEAPWWTELCDRPQLWVFESLGGEPERPAALAVGRLPPASLARGVSYRVAPQDGARPRPGEARIAAADGRVLLASRDGDDSPALDRTAGVLGSAPATL